MYVNNMIWHNSQVHKFLLLNLQHILLFIKLILKNDFKELIKKGSKPFPHGGIYHFVLYLELRLTPMEVSVNFL